MDGGAEEGVNGVLYAHNANAYEKDADAAEDSEGVFVGGAPVPHQRPPLDENRYDDEIEIADDELHREKIIPMRREEDLRYDDHNARDEDPYAQPRDIYWLATPSLKMYLFIRQSKLSILQAIPSCLYQIDLLRDTALYNVVWLSLYGILKTHFSNIFVGNFFFINLCMLRHFYGTNCCTL